MDDCCSTVNENKNADVFGIDCGDLAGDKPDLYPKYIENLNRANIPFYRVLGNHDMNYGGRSDETSTKIYNQTFGPAYYSFNRGKVHYVILDNVFYFGRIIFTWAILMKEYSNGWNRIYHTYQKAQRFL